jgi:hypothetical protein
MIKRRIISVARAVENFPVRGKLRIVNRHVVGMALDADVVLTLSEQRSHAAESLLRAYFNARRTAVREAGFSQTYDQPSPATSDLDLAV